MSTVENGVMGEDCLLNDPAPSEPGSVKESFEAGEFVGLGFR